MLSIRELLWGTLSIQTLICVLWEPFSPDLWCHVSRGTRERGQLSTETSSCPEEPKATLHSCCLQTETTLYCKEEGTHDLGSQGQLTRLRRLRRLRKSHSSGSQKTTRLKRCFSMLIQKQWTVAGGGETLWWSCPQAGQ